MQVPTNVQNRRLKGRLLGLGCTQRVGKDTVAEYLVGEHGWVQFAFADNVRALTSALYPDVADAVYHTNWEEAKEDLEVRKALIDVGVEVRRHTHPDVWIWAIAEQVAKVRNQGKDVVISDVRFLDEVRFVRQTGGRNICLTREGSPQADLRSESLTEADFDYVHRNDGDIDELYEWVDDFIINDGAVSILDDVTLKDAGIL